MRIAIPPPPPLTMPAPVRLDRAAIAQVAAVAAAMPWTALDALVADRTTQAGAPASPAPVPVPPALPLPLSPDASAAALAARLQGRPLAAAPGQLPSLPAVATPASATPVLLPSLPGLPMAAWPDRLTLSRLAATPAPGVAARSQGPTGDWLRGVLAALTGDEGAVCLDGFDLPPGREPALVAAPGGRHPQDLLHLLLRGTAVGSDQRAVDLTLGLSVQRQAQAGVLLDAAVLDAVHGALEQLASREVDLEFPGAAASLVGQSLRFQASFDPLALWPMQSFLLSGLLIFGRARALDDDEPVLADDEADAEADAQPGDDAAEREPQSSPDQPPPKKRRRRAAPDVPTPLPADGGAPIISARHWLELELRHWRVQVRRWMALPTGDAAPDVTPGAA